MPLLKLLVVEDDTASLELMTEVFSSLKVEVRPLSDSQKAAVLVTQERFDGIFLDLEMPNLNGFQLAQKVRESVPNKSTPVVIVTARDQPHTMQESFAMGATFFLQKPVDRQKLTNLLRTVRGPLFENRRHYVRVPLQTKVTCVIGSRTLPGTSWNLSQGGIQVEVDGLNLGVAVQLSFRLPASATVIDALGVVVWANEGRQGIHFTKISVPHQEEVRAYIAQAEPTR